MAHIVKSNSVYLYIRFFRCENDVATCIRNAPIVKLMLAALKSSGCEVDPKRHISCEPCNSAVTGGYDAEANQVSTISVLQESVFHRPIILIVWDNSKLYSKRSCLSIAIFCYTKIVNYISNSEVYSKR